MVRAAMTFLYLGGLASALCQAPLIDANARGDLAMREGRFAEANRAYDEALGLVDPANKEILAGLFYKKARAHRDAGEVLVALEAAEMALHYREHDLFKDLQAELQLLAKETVFTSDEILNVVTEVLRIERDFGVAGGKREPSFDVWVGFEFDSAELTTQGSRQATEIAKAMLDQRGHRFTLVGHTDVLGPAEYNLHLSNRRARGLRTWLVDRFGIRAERLEAEGRGESEPVAEGDSEDAHSRNRRVEVKLLR